MFLDLECKVTATFSFLQEGTFLCHSYQMVGNVTESDRQVVSRFGDKWSMLVLYMLHTSETGVLRFNEIRRLMTDCSQKMLSQTLKNLEQSHLVHREVYPEVPPRVEYSLTGTGRSLMPAIIALIDWGKEHFDEVVTD